jgi:hypothetical protein
MNYEILHRILERLPGLFQHITGKYDICAQVEIELPEELCYLSDLYPQYLYATYLNHRLVFDIQGLLIDYQVAVWGEWTTSPLLTKLQMLSA